MQIASNLTNRVGLYPRMTVFAASSGNNIPNSISSDRLTIRDVTFHRNDIAFFSSKIAVPVVPVSVASIAVFFHFSICRLSFM